MTVMRGKFETFQPDLAAKVFSAVMTVLVLLISLCIVLAVGQYQPPSSIERSGNVPLPRTPWF